MLDVDIDDLALSASDLLDQFRERGMPDTIHRRILDTAHQTNNLEKLKDLVARFQAAVQNHDAKLAAAQTALMEHAGLNRNHAIHETLHGESSSGRESSNSTSGSCTITIGRTHQENVRTTALAAARLAACPADNERPGRLPSDEWAAFGKSLLFGADSNCAKLRERICRLLCNNEKKCRIYILSGPSIAKDGDIAPADYSKALKTAKKIGLPVEGFFNPKDDIVKAWAVALLHERTHCTEAVMQAVLASDFDAAM
jgi:hypothetical protein